VATTGCLGGVVCQALLRGDQAGALRLAGRLQDDLTRDGLSEARLGPLVHQAINSRQEGW
jgi:hypothetical protein